MEFIQGLISGIGILLGFTLASQLIVLFEALEQEKKDFSEGIEQKEKEIRKLFSILSWFFTIITVILSAGLYILQLSIFLEKDKENLYVAGNMVGWVNFAIWGYVIVLVLLNVFQFCSSMKITQHCKKKPLLHDHCLEKTPRYPQW